MVHRHHQGSGHLRVLPRRQQRGILDAVQVGDAANLVTKLLLSAAATRRPRESDTNNCGVLIPMWKGWKERQIVVTRHRGYTFPA